LVAGASGSSDLATRSSLMQNPGRGHHCASRERVINVTEACDDNRVFEFSDRWIARSRKRDSAAIIRVACHRRRRRSGFGHIPALQRFAGSDSPILEISKGQCHVIGHKRHRGSPRTPSYTQREPGLARCCYCVLFQNEGQELAQQEPPGSGCDESPKFRRTRLAIRHSAGSSRQRAPPDAQTAIVSRRRGQGTDYRSEASLTTVGTRPFADRVTGGSFQRLGRARSVLCRCEYVLHTAYVLNSGRLSTCPASLARKRRVASDAQIATAFADSAKHAGFANCKGVRGAVRTCRAARVG
jgi:hypothetical protein